MHHFGTNYRFIQSVLIGFVLILSVLPAHSREIAIPLGSAADFVNSQIEKAAKGSRLNFESGVYNFSQPILIERDDIALIGQGANETIFKFDTAKGDFLTIKGGVKSKPVLFKESAAVENRKIVLASPLNLKPGDAVYIHQPNSESYISQWENVSWKEAKHRPFREGIHLVEAVDGSDITLKTPLAFAMTGGEAKAQKISLRKRVSLQGFQLISSLGESIGYDFSNTHPNFAKAASIRALRTQNLDMRDITILNSPSSAFVLESSINASVNGLKIDGAHNKGGGGNGYGVELHEAFDNQLDGLTIFDMRHAVIFSAWHAETGNTVHVSETNRDINFHGSVDLNNTVTVDKVELAYAPDRSSSKRRNVWKIISGGGTNHAETDFLAVNAVALKQAAGSYRDETLVAAKNAVLSGGYGADRFIVASGTIIEDYEPSDIIEIAMSADDVSVVQKGKHVAIHAKGIEPITIKNASVAELNIEFAPTNSV